MDYVTKNSDKIDTSDNTIVTVNAVIFQKKDNERQFLIVQENDGQWGLAGGAKDIDDTDIIETLKRELQEELSLVPTDYDFSVTKTKIEFVYDDRSSTRFGKKGIIIFFTVEILHPEKIKPSAELKDVAWMSEANALKNLSFEEVKDGFKEVLDEIK